MLTDFEYQEAIEILFLEDGSFEDVQERLDLCQDKLEQLVERLKEDGYMTFHTVH